MGETVWVPVKSLQNNLKSQTRENIPIVVGGQSLVLWDCKLEIMRKEKSTASSWVPLPLNVHEIFN